MLYYDQEMHTIISQIYHTATCFDIILSSSDSL